jgi:hypothetical protein
MTIVACDGEAEQRQQTPLEELLFSLVIVRTHRVQLCSAAGWAPGRNVAAALFLRGVRWRDMRLG